jgi:L-alanine-DL-glutamate epimerase-like enolase superfamily enzyme
VKLAAATVYALRIPFVEAFRHSTKDRSWSDAVVVRVRDDRGVEGFGEGLARPYVTGETVEGMVEFLAQGLWPGIGGRDLPELRTATDLGALDALMPRCEPPGVIAANASRAALETAIIDCALRRRGRSVGELLPPRRCRITYSGVITAGTLETTLQHARRLKLVGLTQIKIKVGLGDDVPRITAVRELFGPAATLRLDANGAWTLEEATEVLNAVGPLDIAAVEQPLPRGSVAELSRLRQVSPVPLMADESLVTLDDAETLIRDRAVDYFNIRVAKCGGLYRSLAIAQRAAAAGIRIQVGSQVGETSILAAAGRHLAAALDDVAFVEGSFGTLLLAEDVSAESVRFGHGGNAPLLRGPGLGVTVLEERLRRYADRVVELDQTTG